MSSEKPCLGDVWDLFPCPKCGNNYAYYVAIKTPQGGERYGKVWNTGAIENPEIALYDGDEWNEDMASSKVLHVKCPECNNTVF